MDNSKTGEALQRAMNLCSRSEKCRRDILDKLQGWGVVNPVDREYIIGELVKHKFIDESRFARAYAIEKHRFNHWGFVKIGMMLRSKGIDEGTIKLAFNEIDPESYRKVLVDELERKRASVKASNIYELKGKMMRFALSRGFESDLIYSVIAEITGN